MSSSKTYVGGLTLEECLRPVDCNKFQCQLCYKEYSTMDPRHLKKCTGQGNQERIDKIKQKRENNNNQPIFSEGIVSLKFDQPVNVWVEYKSNQNNSPPIQQQQQRITSVLFNGVSSRPKFVQAQNKKNNSKLIDTPLSSTNYNSTLNELENQSPDISLGRPASTPLKSTCSNDRKRPRSDLFDFDDSGCFSPITTTEVINKRIRVDSSSYENIDLSVSTDIRMNENSTSRKEQIRSDIAIFFVKSEPNSSGSQSAICKLCVHEEVCGDKNSNLSRHLQNCKMHQEHLAKYNEDPKLYPYVRDSVYNYAFFQSRIFGTHLIECVLSFIFFNKGLSFNSMSDVSEAIRMHLDSNFHCAKDKMSNVCRNVFAPFAYDQMVSELNNTAQHVALHWDTSTLNNTKIFIVLVKFYVPGDGIKIRCLAVRSIVGETAQDLSDIIIEEVDRIGFDKKKIAAISADNTNSSFGGLNHHGERNVRQFLENWLRRKVLVCACMGHIGNNSVKATIKEAKPTFDIAAAINKSYAHFNQMPKRRDELLQIWVKDLNRKSENMRYPLSYVPTRWLSIRPGANRLVMLKEAMQIYINKLYKDLQRKRSLGAEATENLEFLYKFFCGAKAHLNTIHLKAFVILTGTISENLRMLQTNEATIMTGMKVLEKSKQHVSIFANKKSITVNLLGKNDQYKSLHDELKDDDDQIDFRNSIGAMFTTCSNYLDDWSKQHKDFEKFEFATLDGPIQYPQVLSAYSFLNIRNELKFKDEVLKLHDQVEAINVYINKGFALKKDGTEQNTVEKWDYIFNQLKADNKQHTTNLIFEIVSIILCCSPTNSYVERVFSEIGYFWDDEKSHLAFQNLWALLMINWNLCRDHKEFADICKSNPELVELSTKDSKYLKTSTWEQAMKASVFEDSDE